jgi:signal transduction histidine kinase
MATAAGWRKRLTHLQGVSQRAAPGAPNTLRRRVGAATLALTGVLIILFITAGLALTDFIHKGNDVVNRWQPAATRSTALLADYLNQETGVRGYALTGQEGFLQPYNDYRVQEAADRTALQSLLAARKDLLTRLHAVEQAADMWQQLTARRIIAQVQQGAAHPANLLDETDDKNRFDAIRSAANALLQRVAAVTNDAKRARKHAADLAVGVAITTGAVVVLASLATWRALQTEVLRPVEQLAAQTRAVSGGELNRVIRPSGPIEIEQLGIDVERMRGRIADELARVEIARDELKRSNADLEQFAYVASHDLSEPLRKVSNFTQLLERQYGNQLDDRAKQYIAFAVDGAKRMQALISDLLALSRVGRTTESFTPVDVNTVLDEALANLEDRIAECDAGIGRSELPTVLGDKSLLVALFENLIGNSIKYRGDGPPLIAVTAVRNPALSGWEFAVTDNGIGIDPQYSERVFAIFQRLHLRDAYGGTGIGLALCRKIVEFHGGRIWLDVTASPGATFRFTIPDRTPQRIPFEGSQ